LKPVSKAAYAAANGMDERETTVVTGRAKNVSPHERRLSIWLGTPCVKKMKILGRSTNFATVCGAPIPAPPFELLLARFEAKTGQNAL
jgi:hypothetical protein